MKYSFTNNLPQTNYLEQIILLHITQRLHHIVSTAVSYMQHTDSKCFNRKIREKVFTFQTRVCSQ